MAECVQHPGVLCPGSQFSSGHARWLPVDHRVRLLCVRANAARCIPRANHPRGLVPSALAPDFRLPERLVPAAGRVVLLAVPDSVTFRAA